MDYYEFVYGQCTSGEIIFAEKNFRPNGDEYFTRTAIIPAYKTGAIERYARETTGKDLYIKYNVFNGQAVAARGASKIGGKHEVDAVLALDVDVDVSSKDSKYGTRDELLTKVDLWLPPSVIINTDGMDRGFHVVYVFKDPYFIRSPEDFRYISEFAHRFYESFSNFMGTPIDRTFGIERLSRPPGSTRKSGRKVIASDFGKKYTLAQLERKAVKQLSKHSVTVGGSSRVFENASSGTIDAYLDREGLNDIRAVLDKIGWTETTNEGFYIRPESSSGSPSGELYPVGDIWGITYKSPGDIVTAVTDPIHGEPVTYHPGEFAWLSPKHLWVIYYFAGDWAAAAAFCEEKLGVGWEFDEVVESTIPRPILLPPKQRTASVRCYGRALKKCQKIVNNRQFGIFATAVEHGLDDKQVARLVNELEVVQGIKEDGTNLSPGEILDGVRAAEQKVIRGIRSRSGSDAEGFADPRRLARVVLSKLYGRCHDDLARVKLRYWREDYYVWDREWSRVSNEDVEGAIVRLLGELYEDHASELQKGYERAIAAGDEKAKPPVVPQLGTSVISNVMKIVRSLVGVESSTDAPVMLGKVPGLGKPRDCVVFQNGILDVETGNFVAPDPRFFGLCGLDFEYDPAAKCEQFVKFLEEIFFDKGRVDRECIRCLLEWIGLNLVADTSFHKIMNLIGPPRSGKGILVAILTALLGHENVATPKLNQLTRPNGMACLIGKSACVVTDSRVTGSMSDREAIVEVLLGISGGDVQTISRKYRDDLITKLGCRITVVANQVGLLPDTSGALAARNLYVETKQSFVGREDMKLQEKLMVELPGIFNLALQSLRELREYGSFQQPQSSLDLIEQAAEMSDPVGTFLEEYCEVGPGFAVEKQTLYDWAKLWYEKVGRSAPSMSLFSRDLYAATNRQITSHRARAGGEERTYYYLGVKLKSQYRDKVPGSDDF
jgi:putative DNA primase/helicase